MTKRVKRPSRDRRRQPRPDNARVWSEEERERKRKKLLIERARNAMNEMRKRKP